MLVSECSFAPVSVLYTLIFMNLNVVNKGLTFLQLRSLVRQQGYAFFTCSTQLSMKFKHLLQTKMLTFIGMITVIFIWVKHGKVL